MTTLLTLPEFAAAAAHAVQACGIVPENGQAKPIPAERMVRYYTTRGLLPRPGSQGRALAYGRTHLLRLVAIKRLQSQGMSLDQIAVRLQGMSPDELEALAAVPPGAMPAALGDPETDVAPAPARVAGRFWAAPPDTGPSPAAALRAEERPEVRDLRAVRLSDTVTLLIDTGSDVPAPDALRRAAAPLLDLLAASGPDRKDTSR